MYKNKKICVVVPAYNEEIQIGNVIKTMPDFVDNIVIIDDTSTDNTVGVIKKHKKINEKIILIQHQKNQGVGGAIATGYKWARDNEFDIAVVMAGDGQMDPQDLSKILDPVADEIVDYSKGNRLVSGEAYQKIPKVRYFGNAILTLLTKIASGYWHVTDSQTGYTAINKKALHLINWDDMYKRYGQPNDLLVRLNVYDLKVKDVVITPVYNIGEKSGIKVRKAVFSISFLLVRRFFWRLKEKYIIRDFHPLVFFYFLSFVLFLTSCGLLVRLIILWAKLGHAPQLTALALLFSCVTCLQTAFFAMWMDSDYNKRNDL